jgi:hypothetical protein
MDGCPILQSLEAAFMVGHTHTDSSAKGGFVMGYRTGR